MQNISKDIFLNSLTCNYLGWSLRNKKISKELTLSDRFSMEQGREIGKRARTLYPDGILINEKDLNSATKKTKRLMEESKASVIFEAAFFVNSYVTKADILKRTHDGWHLIEVKSGLKTQPKYIEDISYTALVIDRLGINISKVSLLLLSEDYRLGMENNDLFVEVDCTEEVQQQLEVIKPYWDKIEETTRQKSEPEQKLQLKCRKCDLFSNCVGKGVENHIFDIPRLSQKKFDKLMEVGIESINDIPDGFDLTENQAKVMTCVKSGEPLVGDNLRSELSSVSWPAFYLDFETVVTAIPLYNDIAPHAQVPTQYSIHKCLNPSKVGNHYEYLADPGKDCRLELAESLIDILQGNGSIIVYSHFERDRINDLIKAFPKLSEKLNNLLERLIDLEKIIKNNFNHPRFYGKTSIKQTLPALVPEMTYAGMAITDGLEAATYFAYLALGKYKDQEAETIKSNLLTYCKQDTLGMVKLHEQLANYI